MHNQFVTIRALIIDTVLSKMPYNIHNHNACSSCSQKKCAHDTSFNVNAPLLLKAAFSSLSSVATHTHTLPFCYHCHSLEVDLKQVRNGWLWFLRNSNLSCSFVGFMFQVDSEGQDQTQNILYAHPVYLQQIPK